MNDLFNEYNNSYYSSMSDNHFKKQCLDIFNSLENQRDNIFAELDLLTNEQRQFSPGPGKWNCLQILLHLKTAEKFSVIYMKKKTSSGGELPSAGFMSWLRLLALKIAFRIPYKFKAPTFIDTTGKEPEYETLKSDWNNIRIDLRGLIKNLDERILRGEIFKQPTVGRMNMKHALEFMQSHTAHHRQQIFRILNHRSFPR